MERWARTALIIPRPAHTMWEARFGRGRRPVWWWRRFGFFGGVRTRGLWRRRVGTRRDMLRALGVLPHARGGGGREPGSDASGSDSDGSDDEWLRAGVLDAGD